MMGFFGAFHSPGVTFMPSVEYTFELYKNLLLAMVLVFQLPTLAFFLAKMRLVTARLLWRKINYAILAIFIVAAVLTPSPDPVESGDLRRADDRPVSDQHRHRWIDRTERVSRKHRTDGESTGLRLVIGAMVMDQAMKHRHTPVAHTRGVC